MKAKDGQGSATLSMAYAGAEFATKIIRALKGETGIIAPTFVNLEADVEGAAALKKELGSELTYFSSRVQLGVRWSFSLMLHKKNSRFCLDQRCFQNSSLGHSHRC